MGERVSLLGLLGRWRRCRRRRWSQEWSRELVESSRVRAETSRVAQRVTKRVAGSLLGLSELLRSSKLRGTLKAYGPSSPCSFLGFLHGSLWRLVLQVELLSACTLRNRTAVGFLARVLSPTPIHGIRVEINVPFV